MWILALVYLVIYLMRLKYLGHFALNFVFRNGYQSKYEQWESLLNKLAVFTNIVFPGIFLAQIGPRREARIPPYQYLFLSPTRHNHHRFCSFISKCYFYTQPKWNVQYHKPATVISCNSIMVSCEQNRYIRYAINHIYVWLANITFWIRHGTKFKKKHKKTPNEPSGWRAFTYIFASRPLQNVS